MSRFFPQIFALLAALSCPLLAQEPALVAAPESSPAPIRIASATVAGDRLSLKDAVVLGLVEGITEFLPVSSTGHLIIASRALGLEGDTPLVNAHGQPLWYKTPSAKNPAGVPLTLSAAADTYTVVIQAGAIAAVMLIYWAQLVGILRGLGGKNAAGLRLLRNILLAFFPAACAGLLLGEWIDAHLFSPRAVIVALISGAALMWGAEHWRRQQSGATESRLEPSELSPGRALGIGLMQCFALWPGMSRSMLTIVGGYFAGLSPARAAEFSFLVGLPTLGGAAVYKGLKTGAATLEVFGWAPVLVGMGVAAVSAGVAVKFLVSYLTRRGLGVFAIYRVLLALVLTIWVMRMG